jgi:hypothetical protein
MPVLETAGNGAFALVIGKRMVSEIRSDGSFHRTSLRSLLPGGTTNSEIVRTELNEVVEEGYEEVKVRATMKKSYQGTVGIKRGESGRPWHFLNGNAYYLDHAGPRIGPAVIVDTDPRTFYGQEGFMAASFETFEARRLFADGLVFIAPHTATTGHFFERYVEWNRARRPPDPLPDITNYLANLPQPWDLDAPPDPLQYAAPIPIRAEFEVTALLEETWWGDHSALEAARALREARYDLKLGIWDLASNSILRQSLLDVVEVRPAPPMPVVLPAGAAARAQAKVEAKMQERASAKEALLSIAPCLAPLRELGWIPADEREPSRYILELTEKVSEWPGAEPRALVQMMLSIIKRQASISLLTGNHREDASVFVAENQRLLESIASPDSCPLSGKGAPVLWRDTGGWADDVDWETRASFLAECTPRWIDAFTMLREQCHQAHLRAMREREESPTSSSGRLAGRH